MKMKTRMKSHEQWQPRLVWAVKQDKTAQSKVSSHLYAIGTVYGQEITEPKTIHLLVASRGFPPSRMVAPPPDTAP